MAATNDDDSQQGLVLGLAVGIISLVMLLVIGIAVWHSGVLRVPVNGASTVVVPDSPSAVVLVAPIASLPAAPSATAAGTVPALAVVTETTTAPVPEGAGIQVVNGVVRFYFASGNADLAPGAAEALANVIAGIKGGKKAVLAGFHDSSGDAMLNRQLAQRRADTVRDVLVGLGVDAAKLEISKPQETTGSGSDAQARRVEVRLIDR
ncbi:MAG: OmpA family protein [Variovorax sp.]